jgi:hypothetical protein
MNGIHPILAAIRCNFRLPGGLKKTADMHPDIRGIPVDMPDIVVEWRYVICYKVSVKIGFCAFCVTGMFDNPMFQFRDLQPEVDKRVLSLSQPNNSSGTGFRITTQHS